MTKCKTNFSVIFSLECNYAWVEKERSVAAAVSPKRILITPSRRKYKGEEYYTAGYTYYTYRGEGAFKKKNASPEEVTDVLLLLCTANDIWIMRVLNSAFSYALIYL